MLQWLKIKSDQLGNHCVHLLLFFFKRFIHLFIFDYIGIFISVHRLFVVGRSGATL